MESFNAEDLDFEVVFKDAREPEERATARSCSASSSATGVLDFEVVFKEPEERATARSCSGSTGVLDFEIVFKEPEERATARSCSASAGDLDFEVVFKEPEERATARSCSGSTGVLDFEIVFKEPEERATARSCSASAGDLDFEVVFNSRAVFDADARGFDESATCDFFVKEDCAVPKSCAGPRSAERRVVPVVFKEECATALLCSVFNFECEKALRLIFLFVLFFFN